jgi:membrane protein implicated in regulation of membrane protease activity
MGTVNQVVRDNIVSQTIASKSFAAQLYDAVIAPIAPIPAENLRDIRLVTSITLVTVVSMFLRLLFGFDIVILVGLITTIVAYVASRTTYWKFSGLIVVMLLAAPSVVNLATTVPEATESVSDWAIARSTWLVLPMLLASIFFSWRSTFLFGLAVIAAACVAVSFNDTVILSNMIGSISLLGILTALLVLAVRHRDMVEQDRQQQLIRNNAELEDIRQKLEERVKERTVELEDVNQELNLLNATLERRIDQRVQELNLSQGELKSAQEALQQAQNRAKGMYTTIDVLLKQLRSVFHHRPSREELSGYMEILDTEYEKLSTYFEN